MSYDGIIKYDNHHPGVKWDSALGVSLCYVFTVIVPLFCLVVFKYLAEKYLQRLKQQTAEDPEVVHTSSNKIGEKCGFTCSECNSALTFQVMTWRVYVAALILVSIGTARTQGPHTQSRVKGTVVRVGFGDS